MSEYRDYGTIGGLGATNSPVNTVRHGLVYQVTHEAEGIRLPFMYRSFMSFSFGGKLIEDFNLIVTTTGDRVSRNGYATFRANTTTPEGLDGDQLWGIHYGNNTLNLNLSTDGMDLRQLDEFLYWFSAGSVRELILAEHPNRAQLARVSEPPTLSVLPFESTVDLNISGNVYKTKTTLYKGEISLKLVMDEPHWYSIENILGKKRDNRYVDLWDDANGNEVSIFASLDALKILYEDGIPLGSMIDNNMLLGNNTYASVEDNIISRIWDPDANEGLGEGAKIDSGDRLTGIIAGAIVDASGEGITSLASNLMAHFFYAGTAPAPVKIMFTLLPTMSNYYITSPFSKYTLSKYNYIAIESETTLKLCFTTPNLFTSYNRTVEIFNNKLNDANDWEDIRAMIRDTVRHPAVRTWANKVLDYGKNVAQSKSAGILLPLLSYLLKDSSGQIYPMSVCFNSETGDAIGTFTYRGITSAVPADASEWTTYGIGNNILFNEVEEDVGDMLLTNHLLITDRNYPTANGRIVKWEDNAVGHKYSHRIYHNVSQPLTNFMLIYKNMYL